ncbi:MAG: DUF3237 domain-containing protein [Actinomycetota bacterium]|nr:DUF3237 domain-containing protein [Actinomycetota bacterium]
MPEFRGVLKTDDGAAILFEWQGLAVLTDSGMRRLLGSLVHTTDDPRYRWLNKLGFKAAALEGGFDAWKARYPVEPTEAERAEAR